MNKKSCVVSVLLLLTFSIGAASQNRKRLSEAEAIQKAEDFIVEQGYTDLPPTEEKSKLVAESVNPGTDAFGMKLRHNSLERKAYGVMREGGKNGAWIVVFRYNKAGNVELRRVVPTFNEQYMEKWGRAVIMDSYGRHIRVEHQNYSLEFEELKKINP